MCITAQHGGNGHIITFHTGHIPMTYSAGYIWDGVAKLSITKFTLTYHINPTVYMTLIFLSGSSLFFFYIHYKVRDEITYPFPKFNGATIVDWEWISNCILHFTKHVITYPCWIKVKYVIDKISYIKTAHGIKTFHISTLYTNLPLDAIYGSLNSLIINKANLRDLKAATGL